MYSASYQSTCRYGTPDFGYDGCLFGDSNARAATAVVDQSLHKTKLGRRSYDVAVNDG
jgi:hypothetical protein